MRPGSLVHGAPWGRKSESVDGGGGWHVPDLIRARGSDAAAACRRGPFRQSRRQRSPKTYPLVRRAGCGRSSRPVPDQRREPILERHGWKTIGRSEPVAALSGWTLSSLVELMNISSTNEPWAPRGRRRARRSRQASGALAWVASFGALQTAVDTAGRRHHGKDCVTRDRPRACDTRVPCPACTLKMVHASSAAS